MLDTRQLTDPQGWSLALRLSPRDLVAMLYGADHARSREVRCWQFTPEQRLDLAGAVSRTIYDNPLLLSDFKEVAVVVETPRVAVIPSRAAAGARRLLEAAHPGLPAACAVELCPIGGQESGDDADIPMLAMALDAPTERFLRRTFPSVAITHNLAVTARYFLSRSTTGGNGTRLYLNIRPEVSDIVVIDRRRLLAAFSRPTRHPMDAAYFAMGALKGLSLAPDDVELFVGAAPALRNPAMEALRRFVPCVMPLIVPADASPDETIPFDLNIYPSLR